MTAATRTTPTARAKARNADVVARAGTEGHVLDPAFVRRPHWRTDLIDPVLSFVVYGIPAGQGSKTYKGQQSGRPVLAEESKYVAPWRRAVRNMAKKAILAKAKSQGTRWVALREPVMVSAIVTVPSTQAAINRGDTYHTGTPDLDKLERAIGDALAPTPVPSSATKHLPAKAAATARSRMLDEQRKTTVLHDDSYIVAWDHVTKVYPKTTTDSLGFSGVTIQVWTMADLEAAAKRPIITRNNTTIAYAHDLATWARPATGETFEAATQRLWTTHQDALLHAIQADCPEPVGLRGRTLPDTSLIPLIAALARHGPRAEVPVFDEPHPQEAA